MADQKNLGLPDRVARIIFGIIAISLVPLAFFGPKSPLAYLGVLGIVPLISGISGYCPPYSLLGINTYRREKIFKQ